MLAKKKKCQLVNKEPVIRVNLSIKNKIKVSEKPSTS